MENKDKKVSSFTITVHENGWSVDTNFHRHDDIPFTSTYGPSFVYTSLNKMFKDLKDTLKSA